jgi:hypothetical protein
MIERAELLGDDLIIERRPGGGTVVCIKLKLGDEVAGWELPLARTSAHQRWEQSRSARSWIGVSKRAAPKDLRGSASSCGRRSRLPSSLFWWRTHASRRGGEALDRLSGRDWPSVSVVTLVFGTWLAARVDAAARADRVEARRVSAWRGRSPRAEHDVSAALGR